MMLFRFGGALTAAALILSTANAAHAAPEGEREKNSKKREVVPPPPPARGPGRTGPGFQQEERGPEPRRPQPVDRGRDQPQPQVDRGRDQPQPQPMDRGRGRDRPDHQPRPDQRQPNPGNNGGRRGPPVAHQEPERQVQQANNFRFGGRPNVGNNHFNSGAHREGFGQGMSSRDQGRAGRDATINVRFAPHERQPFSPRFDARWGGRSMVEFHGANEPHDQWGHFRALNDPRWVGWHNYDDWNYWHSDRFWSQGYWNQFDWLKVRLSVGGFIIVDGYPYFTYGDPWRFRGWRDRFVWGRPGWWDDSWAAWDAENGIAWDIWWPHYVQRVYHDASFNVQYIGTTYVTSNQANFEDIAIPSCGTRSIALQANGGGLNIDHVVVNYSDGDQEIIDRNRLLDNGQYTSQPLELAKWREGGHCATDVVVVAQPTDADGNADDDQVQVDVYGIGKY